MSKIQEKDRRKFARLRAHHLVKYQPLGEQKEDNALPVISSIRDIGGGGVCLLVEEHLPASSVIELKINFPHADTPLTALAKVIWVRKVKGAGHYEVGAEFIQIEDSMRQLLDAQVQAVYRRVKDERFINFLLKKGAKK